MKTRDEILASWDTEGINADWYAIDSYTPSDGAIYRLYVGTLEDATEMMRQYAEPAETWGAPFHRMSLITPEAAKCFMEDEQEELDERSAYSISEAAGILNVSRQRVHAMLKAGQLEGQRDGNRWKIYRYSVESRLAK